MNTPRTILTGVLVLAALLGAAACEPRVEHSTERQHGTYQQEITRIEFTLDAGDIAISTRPDGIIDVSRRLRWRSTKPTITEEVAGSTLRIDVSCSSGCSVDYEVKAPAGVIVDAHTSAGDITVDGAVSELQADTSAGDVSGSRLTAPKAIVKTAAGDVRLGFQQAPTAVEISSAAGDVTLSVPRVDGGYQVDAGTSAGDRTVNLDPSLGSTRTLKAHTAAGDVTVWYS